MHESRRSPHQNPRMMIPDSSPLVYRTQTLTDTSEGTGHHLEDLEVGRVLAEAERVEAEIARLAAVFEHVHRGKLALVRKHLEEADGEHDLAERLRRDLQRRYRSGQYLRRTQAEKN